MAYRSAYSFGSLSRKTSKLTAFDDFIFGIVPGIAFQMVGTIFVNWQRPCDYEIDLESLGKILFNDGASTEFKNLQRNLSGVFLYNISLILFAALIGFLFRKAIRYLNLDHHCRALRFSNEWFYTLRGETKFFKEQKGNNERRNIASELLSRIKFQVFKVQKAEEANKEKRIFKPRVTFRRNHINTCTVFAVVKSDQGKCFIYNGFIHSFFLANDGSLDCIYLTGAQRKPFSEDSDDKYYTIPAIDFVVLKNSEIINFSVQTVPSLNIHQGVKQEDLKPKEDTDQDSREPYKP